MISFCFCCPYLELLVCFIYKSVVSRKLKKNIISKTLQNNIVKSDKNDTYWMDLSEWFVLNCFMTWKCHGWDCECSIQFSSVAQLCLTLCDPMDYIQHARFPCPSPTPGACSNSCPLSQWCHLTISSSVITFSSCLPSFPTSVSFPISQFFASGGRSIGVSASALVLPMNIQDWFPLGFFLCGAMQ